MGEKAAIVGIGYEGFRRRVDDLSTREMIFSAAQRACEDADVDPRKDVDAFISCAEDLSDGWSITDEMVPDPMGGALRPVHTVAGDGLQGLAQACMLIRTGAFGLVMVEAHAKASDIVALQEVRRFALDPIFVRPIVEDADVIAALERSLFSDRPSEELIMDLIVECKRRALLNPRASYGARLTREEVLSSPYLWAPMRAIEKAPPAEAAIVLLVGSRAWANRARVRPIWVEAAAYITDARPLTDRIERRPMAAEACVKALLKMAGLEGLPRLDMVELDDTYAHKALQLMEALDLPAGRLGAVNPSGGSLGVGALLEATGLAKALECALAIRGQAPYTAGEVKRALAFSWRGVPSGTYAAALLSAEEGPG